MSSRPTPLYPSERPRTRGPSTTDSHASSSSSLYTGDDKADEKCRSAQSEQTRARGAAEVWRREVLPNRLGRHPDGDLETSVARVRRRARCRPAPEVLGVDVGANVGERVFPDVHQRWVRPTTNDQRLTTND